MYTLPILDMGILIYGYRQYYRQLHYIILPDASSATPDGQFNVADVAAPLSPLKVVLPVPAIVVLLIHILRQFYDSKLYQDIDNSIDDSIASLLQLPQLERHSKIIRSLTGDLGGLGIYNYGSGYGKILYNSLQETARNYINSHEIGDIDIDFKYFSNGEIFKCAGDDDDTLSDKPKKRLSSIQLHRLKDHEHDTLMHSLSHKEETAYIVENMKGASFTGSGALFNFNNLGHRIKTNVYSAIIKNRLNVAITNMPQIPPCSAGPNKTSTCGYNRTSALRYGHYVGTCMDHVKQWTQSHNLLRDTLSSLIQRHFAKVEVTRESTVENTIAPPSHLSIQTKAKTTYKRGDIKVAEPALTFTIDCAITACTLSKAIEPYRVSRNNINNNNNTNDDVPKHKVNDKFYAISAKEVDKKSLYKNQQNFIPFVVNNQGLIGNEGRKLFQLLERDKPTTSNTRKASPFIKAIEQNVIRICAIRSAYERIRGEAYFARLNLQ